MVDDEGIADPEVWGAAIEADATAELDLAEQLWEAVAGEHVDAATADLAAAERIWRDLIARLEGESELDAAKAQGIWDTLEERWEKEITSNLTTSYKAVQDIGGTPYIAMPYVTAALERDDPIQDAIDQIYAPNGIFTDAADPVQLGAVEATDTGEVPAVIDESSSSSSSESTDTTVPPPPPTPPLPPPTYIIPAVGCVQNPVTGVWGRWEFSPNQLYPDGTPRPNQRAHFVEDSACIPVLVPPPPPYVPPPPAVPTVPTIPPPPVPPSPPAPSPPPPAQCCPEQPDVIVNLPPPPPPPPPADESVMPFAPPVGVSPGDGNLQSWNDTAICADELHQDEGKPDTNKFAEDVGSGLQSIVGYLVDSTLGRLSDGLAFNRILKAGVSTIVDSCGFFISLGVKGVMKFTATNSIRVPALTFTSMFGLSAGGWLQRILAMPFDYLQQGTRYDLQYSAPQFLPSQAEVDALFVMNRIDAKLWECWTRAHGNIPEHRSLWRDAQTIRPNVAEEIKLEQLGVNTPAATDSQLKRLGVLGDRDRDAYRILSRYVPGPGDLVRFMLRDVFDRTAVEAGGYDQEFDKKFLDSDAAKAIAKANGIDVETMRAFWRAHWNIPSYTQLTECLHRLRPGNTPPGVEPVTAEQVEEALKIDDMAPAWVKRMMAISYNTITRTDLQMWYTDGSITRAELIQRLQDNGYTAADAKRIVDAWDYTVANRKANRSRTWTRNAIVKQYIDGGIGQAKARELLGRTIKDEFELREILADADAIREARSRQTCIKAARKRYLKGEYTDSQLLDSLFNIGLDYDQRIQFAAAWACELASSDKQPTIALFEQWFHRGTVTKDEIYQRLLNLRYKPADAEAIIVNMVLTEDEKRDAMLKSAFNERLAQAKKIGKLTAKQKKEFSDEIAQLEAIGNERVHAAASARRRFNLIMGGETRSRNRATAKEAEIAAAAAKAAGLDPGENLEVLPQPRPADVGEMDTAPPLTDNPETQPSEPVGSAGAMSP